VFLTLSIIFSDRKIDIEMLSGILI